MGGAMGLIVSVSPFRCRMWEFHDRQEAYLTEQTCRSEIESFEKHGQLVPALGRPVVGDSDYDVELICGARRLFVARHINKPLHVELRELTDLEAIVAMDMENRQRSDLTPYERGMSYARWLRVGHFAAQEDLARALGLSSSQVSRLVKLARLPAVVVAAFDSPADIREAWALNLVDALEDGARRSEILESARAFRDNPRRFNARQIYRRLLVRSGPDQRAALLDRDEIVRGQDGLALFRVRNQTNSVAIVLSVSRVSAKQMADIKDVIVGVLEPAGGRGFVTSITLRRAGRKGVDQ
jgi:ParB family transcriptional regulator, chromosome partitioning protein